MTIIRYGENLKLIKAFLWFILDLLQFCFNCWCRHFHNDRFVVSWLQVQNIQNLIFSLISSWPFTIFVLTAGLFLQFSIFVSTFGFFLTFSIFCFNFWFLLDLLQFLFQMLIRCLRFPVDRFVDSWLEVETFPIWFSLWFLPELFGPRGPLWCILELFGPWEQESLRMSSIFYSPVTW